MVSSTQRKRIAPYAPASAVSEFFDHIRYVKTPDKVDSGLLEDYGIARSQTFPLLSTLKFLDIIDADGTTTPAFRALQTGGEEFQAALKEVVQRAYSELFSRLDVSRDTRDKVTNYFARNDSPATANKATALFLDLCGEAGIPTAASARGERSETPRNTPRPAPRKTERNTKIQPPPANLQLETYPPRVVVELRLTEDDLSVMSQQDIQAVFEAAAKIEIARVMARNRAMTEQAPNPVYQEAARDNREAVGA